MLVEVERAGCNFSPRPQWRRVGTRPGTTEPKVAARRCWWWVAKQALVSRTRLATAAAAAAAGRTRPRFDGSTIITEVVPDRDKRLAIIRGSLTLHSEDYTRSTQHSLPPVQIEEEV